MTTPTRTAWLGPLVAALLLTACTDDSPLAGLSQDDSGAPTESSPAATLEPGETDRSPGASNDDFSPTPADPTETTAQPGEDTESPSPDAAPPTPGSTEPVAVLDGSPPLVELRVMEVRRVDNAVVLDFEVEAGTGEVTTSATLADVYAAPEDRPLEGDVGIASMRRWNFSAMSLVDQANQKRHLVLRDTQGECLCGRLPSAGVEEGQVVSMSAQFPAPPADVDTMTLQAEGFESTEVTISEVDQ